MKETIFLPPFFTKKMSVCTPSMISGLAILLVLINSTLLLLLLSSSSQSAYAQSFGNLTNLSNNTGFSSTPQITAFGANVYVVWRDNSSGKDQIYFKRSSDNGNSFYPTEDLSNNNGSSTNPQITANGNNVYTVWSDTTTGNGDIYFKSSIDNGTSFASSKNLSRNLNGTAHFPQLEATGNNAYVVWQDETPERGGIRFRASNDNGNNFSITRVLSQKNDVNANSPQIAVSENTVYIVWEDNSRSGNGNSSKNFDLLFRVSTNGGSNFTNTKVLTKNPGDSFDPQTAISGENMYAVWE